MLVILTVLVHGQCEIANYNAYNKMFKQSANEKRKRRAQKVLIKLASHVFQQWPMPRLLTFTSLIQNIIKIILIIFYATKEQIQVIFP